MISYLVNPDLFLRFGASLLIGSLIGLQRVYAHGKGREREIFAGVRTFALMALDGSAAVLLADQFNSFWIFIGLVFLLGTMVIAAYYVIASEEDEIGLTSEVPALTNILIGGICYYYSIEFAAALGVVTTVLLAV